MGFRQRPKVSVIVCIYNGEKTLLTCIKSLLGQTYPCDSYEIVFVDDGSNDRSAKICRQVLAEHSSEFPTMTYARQDNNGLSCARNTGIFLSKGEIISFIDQDAMADRKWIAELVTAFGDDMNIGVVAGRTKILNGESKFARFIYWMYYYQLDRHGQEVLPVMGTNMAYRRDVFNKVGGFFNMFRERGDEDAFLLKVRRYFRVQTTPKALIYHEHLEKLSTWLRERFKDGYFRAAIVHLFWKKVDSKYSNTRWVIYILYMLMFMVVPTLFLIISLIVKKIALWAGFMVLFALLGYLGVRKEHYRWRFIELVRDFGPCKGSALSLMGVFLSIIGKYIRAIGFFVRLLSNHKKTVSVEDSISDAQASVINTRTNFD